MWLLLKKKNVTSLIKNFFTKTRLVAHARLSGSILRLKCKFTQEKGNCAILFKRLLHKNEAVQLI